MKISPYFGLKSNSVNFIKYLLTMGVTISIRSIQKQIGLEVLILSFRDETQVFYSFHCYDTELKQLLHPMPKIPLSLNKLIFGLYYVLQQAYFLGVVKRMKLVKSLCLFHGPFICQCYGKFHHSGIPACPQLLFHIEIR